MPEHRCHSDHTRDADESSSSAWKAARWTAIGMVGVIAWLAVDLHATLAVARSRIGSPADGLRVDPAAATVAELELIPGIGPATAGRIVMHRLEHGVTSLLAADAEGSPRWALDAVPGVGPLTARRAAPYLVPASMAGRTDVLAVRR